MSFRRCLLAVALSVAGSGLACGQYQLPPGTSSSVPDTERQTTPSPENAVLQKAEAAIAGDRFGDAVALLTPLATPAQQIERVFYDLGFAQDALGHDGEAAIAYREALKRDANDAAARVSLGLLLARGTNRAAAEEQLTAAAKITGAPPDLVAHADRALAQIHLESNPEQANADLLAALKLSTETPEDAALAAEIAVALHDNATAEIAYAHAAQMAPGDAEVALGHARLLSREKRYAEAEAALQPALKAHPQNRELQSELAAQQMLQGQTGDAIHSLESLHASTPADVPITRLLASAYVTGGSPEKADPLYAALLAANPKDVSLQVEWADCLIRQKRSSEAEPVLQHALAQPGAFPDPQARANAYGMLAFAASANHDPETVLKALANRETVAPSTAPFTFLLASAHDTLHHTKQAADAYRLFVQQSGGKFPDQEWQAQQRLHLLDRSK